MKTLTMIDKFKDYWNNYLPLSKRQAISWLIKIEKEVKALEIIKKYISMNRAFKNLANKESLNLTLVEIKALIPDEEYELLKEVLNDEH